MKATERNQEVYIREWQSDELYTLFVRLVGAPDIVGGIDAIWTVDVDASIDFDAAGNAIGFHMTWNKA